MLKHLLALIFIFSVFSKVFAQVLPPDTISKQLPKADSIKVKMPSDPDTLVKRSSPKKTLTGHSKTKTKRSVKPDSSSVSLIKRDTALSKLKTDSNSKHLIKAKSIGKHPRSGVLIKHKTDSTAKHLVKIDTIAKHLPVVDTAKRSPVSTLTYAQYDSYTKGEDFNNFSTLAESNHFPLPDKVLKVAKQVGLTPLQTTKITAMATELTRKKKEMGVFIIRNERVLDSLFRSNKLSDGTLIFYTNRSGLYYGELRNAILQACYATKQVLTALQIKRYEAAKQPE